MDLLEIYRMNPRDIISRYIDGPFIPFGATCVCSQCGSWLQLQDFKRHMCVRVYENTYSYGVRIR
jgi:hypothetical protein